jgi:hypothetical protein
VEAGSDAQVIAASRSEPHAFATIFDRHFDAVHRYLARRVGADLADDLAAEAFTEAFDFRARFDTARTDARPCCSGSPRTSFAIISGAKRDGCEHMPASTAHPTSTRRKV